MAIETAKGKLFGHPRAPEHDIETFATPFTDRKANNHRRGWLGPHYESYRNSTDYEAPACFVPARRRHHCSRLSRSERQQQQHRKNTNAECFSPRLPISASFIIHIAPFDNVHVNRKRQTFLSLSPFSKKYIFSLTLILGEYRTNK